MKKRRMKVKGKKLCKEVEIEKKKGKEMEMEKVL